MTLTVWTAAWSEGRMRGLENASLRPPGAQMHVTVKEGSLSVNLREASVREVLAMIGQQAGLRLRIDAAVTSMVSAQFTAMALDQGLRRLLRGASLSYALLYTRGPAATAILDEVRVFGEARREPFVSHDQAAIQLAQRAAAQLTPPPREEYAEPEPTEPEQEADALAEPEPEADTPED
jgi:type II secretory pathway component GspD/PulD (secretin)